MKKNIILLLTVICFSFVTAQEENTPWMLVQKQIDAYNAKNLDAFAATFSDDIVFYETSMKVNLKGKEQLRKAFGDLFQKNPDLYCLIEDKIVLGDTVIFHEKVQFQKGQPMFDFIVMYKISNDKITEVHFLKRTN